MTWAPAWKPPAPHCHLLRHPLPGLPSQCLAQGGREARQGQWWRHAAVPACRSWDCAPPIIPRQPHTGAPPCRAPLTLLSEASGQQAQHTLHGSGLLTCRGQFVALASLHTLLCSRDTLLQTRLLSSILPAQTGLHEDTRLPGSLPHVISKMQSTCCHWKKQVGAARQVVDERSMAGRLDQALTPCSLPQGWLWLFAARAPPVYFV